MTIEEQTIKMLVDEAALMMSNLGEVSFANAFELFETLNDAITITVVFRKKFEDQNLRCLLCDWRDSVLTHLVLCEQGMDSAELPFTRMQNGECKGVYIPTLRQYWDNTRLMKECGVGPYLLARRQNAKSVMFFCHPDREYPYLKYLPGMELDYTVHPERILNGKVQNIEHYSEYIDYLRAHKDEMDILCLQGPYNSYFDFIERYRALRQDGKIYMALDMSCEWAKGYPWDMESVTEFFSRLDAIATSCRKMRDVLNRDKQVNFGCWWMPNGFYGTEDAPATADARLKENVILTVGRIGTAQKNNEEMLNAFALASKDIPTWSLRLVGKVDNRFKPFMQRYFAANPQLKQRVIFTGPILDKAELYKEYARAKIFCLTSQVEGGTPNVYAEALFHGCAFLTTDIDAANDITADGTLGASYPLRDIKQLANLMREYCKKTTPHFMRQHIAKALDYGRRYYDWRLNARKLEYMIFSGHRAPER